jgi:hypothetical protein
MTAKMVNAIPKTDASLAGSGFGATSPLLARQIRSSAMCIKPLVRLFQLTTASALQEQ